MVFAGLLALSIAWAAAPAQAQAPSIDPACGASTADIRVLPMTVGMPVELSVTLALLTACDEQPDDPRSAVVDWGDGVRSAATIALGATSANGLPMIVVSAGHVYRTAPAADPQSGRRGYPLTVAVTNERTGRIMRDARYVAATNVAPPNPGSSRCASSPARRRADRRRTGKARHDRARRPTRTGHPRSRAGG